MLNKKALAATAAGEAIYIEDVFSTYLYDGTGSAQTFTNGIDLSTEGGLVWIKARSGTEAVDNHIWTDTVRGNTKNIYSNLDIGQTTSTTRVTAFNTNGFSIGTEGSVNNSTTKYASWTFRKAEKFFDVVTYTGDGSNRTIAHNLNSVPGCIFIKRTDTSADWQVYHRSLANTEYLVLNSTAAKATGATRWNSTTPTSTVFSLGTDATVNANGGTYVAYLFAHDAGGFGDSGSESVIKCGSYTAGTNDEVVLDWEPQWLMIKNVDSIPRYQGDWNIFDNMRGLPVGGSDRMLWANSTDSEYTGTANGIDITATGFKKLNWENSGSDKYIYIAIRRGPMKTPEAGTEVFSPVSQSTAATAPRTVTAGFPVDFVLFGDQPTNWGYNWSVQDRLRGGPNVLFTSGTSAENTGSNSKFDSNTAFRDGWVSGGTTGIYEMFRRAPGFFDVVCYTGDASTTARPHNLGVAPQLMIIKQRNDGANSWYVYAEPLGNNKYLILDSTNGQATASFWNNQTPTATNFYIRASGWPNEVGGNYVAYLFASAAGVSKVGSYTGNGSSQTINCGFTGGARFVLIKETTNASSGSWVVFDSARGIVSGNDPYLLLNSTAAEVTDKDAVDTDSTGFIVNETTGPNVNTNSSTYIFLAIA